MYIIASFIIPLECIISVVLSALNRICNRFGNSTFCRSFHYLYSIRICVTLPWYSIFSDCRRVNFDKSQLLQIVKKSDLSFHKASVRLSILFQSNRVEGFNGRCERQQYLSLGYVTKVSPDRGSFIVSTCGDMFCGCVHISALFSCSVTLLAALLTLSARGLLMWLRMSQRASPSNVRRLRVSVIIIILKGNNNNCICGHMHVMYYVDIYSL